MIEYKEEISNENKFWAGSAEIQAGPVAILLNEGSWYRGKENMPRLANMVKRYWNTHSPIMEVIFLWNDTFEYQIYE